MKIGIKLFRGKDLWEMTESKGKKLRTGRKYALVHMNRMQEQLPIVGQAEKSASSYKLCDRNHLRESCNYKLSYISMWGLLARGSFYKVLAAAASMAAAEGILFYYGRKVLYSRQGVSDETISQIFDGVRMHPIFLITLGLVFFILLWTEKRLDSKSGNTMLRLRVSQNQFYVIKTIYNILCLLLVFAVQIALVFWMIWTCKRDAGRNAPQIYFFAFYGDQFLHCLLPMAETGKWVRNGLMLIALGMEAAGMKEKSNYIRPIGEFIVTAYWFKSYVDMNVLDVFFDIVFVLVIAKEVFTIKHAKQD